MASAHAITNEPVVTGVSVAVAVENLSGAVARYREAFGLAEPSYAQSEADGVEVAVFALGGSQLQLVAATSEESVIAKDLAARGSGLHHFGFIVRSVDDTLSHLIAHGFRTLGETARPGAGGNLVGFVHPATTLGAIVELVEPPQGDER